MNKKASGIFSISWKYLIHWLHSGRKNGFGIHSPYVYVLVRNVIYNKKREKVPSEIIEYHKSIRNSREKIVINDLGAGSRITKSGQRSLASLARRSSVTYRQGALLYRLAKWYRPAELIEFGTGLGISTAYLAAGAGTVPFTSIEGSCGKHAFAVSHAEESGLKQVELIRGEFKNHFRGLVNKASDHLLVFIDGDHRYGPTIEKVKAILENKKITEFILILDDIYWSKEMERCWNECRNDPGISISLDLFYFGILIKRPEMAKKHYMLKL